MPAPDVWDRLTAIGTLSASVIALGVAVVPVAYRRWIGGPRLKVRVGEKEPHQRLTGQSPQRVASLRAEIRNKGRAEARRVRVRVLRWSAHDPQPGLADWVDLDIEPVSLHWANTPIGRILWSSMGKDTLKERGTPPEVNLTPKGWDLIQLVHWRQSGRYHALALDDVASAAFQYTSTRETGRFYMEISVTSENAKPRRVGLEYVVDDQNFFHDVKRARAPKKSRPGSMLALFQLAREELKRKQPPDD